MRLGPGSQRRSFQVRLDSAFTIEGMLYQRYKSVLYLYYQISDGEDGAGLYDALRSEEHTSELQSRLHLVCRLLLEKKKNKHRKHPNTRGGRKTTRGHLPPSLAAAHMHLVEGIAHMGSVELIAPDLVLDRQRPVMPI